MVSHTFAICAYKQSPYLEECICSLTAQTVKRYIIIATSTPNDYIKALAEKYHLSYYIIRERVLTWMEFCLQTGKNRLCYNCASG